jgi:hypothetical protein
LQSKHCVCTGAKSKSRNHVFDTTTHLIFSTRAFASLQPPWRVRPSKLRRIVPSHRGYIGVFIRIKSFWTEHLFWSFQKDQSKSVLSGLGRADYV